MWLPNQIQACLDCMDDILLSINEPVSLETELESEDIELLSKLQMGQDRKRGLLNEQLKELTQKMYDLQKIIKSGE